ncbi:GSCFA domain-containing protein [Brumimicrobium mesophilum]|uniref:GSCFA domain-containing protein n=1 Tax=Brumimicrobium mesophilum TaxID=392717 RepID=UPI000D141ECB|nr:GSCFA domain-containing protein [Brumimicrobium mesophilum]
MYKTKIKIAHQNLIDYHSNYSFLGSCFSEHLSKKMLNSGFNVQSNPFGVVFNPISLAELILRSDECLKDSIFERDDVALSWVANSTCFAYSQKELKSKLIELRKDFLRVLSTSKILFVTFGTAWIYEKKSSNQIVANCHKAPKEDFEKRLLSSNEIIQKWTEVIEKLNTASQTKIIFTVSPVRHTKDGMIENSRSKAILLNAVHELNDKFSNVDYFPAYELMIDEMRDYAFYGKDGIHPNEIAVEEIWTRFKDTYFSEQAGKIYKEYDKIRILFQHKALHPSSKKAKQFQDEREKKLKEFMGRFDFVDCSFISSQNENSL